MHTAEEKENKRENIAVTDRTNILVSWNNNPSKRQNFLNLCGEIVVKVSKTAASLCKLDLIIH